MSSSAQAGTSARSAGPPSASAAARQRMGRSRLPPAKRLWRIARWSVEGQSDSGGTRRSSSESISPRRAERYPAIASPPVVVARVLARDPRLEGNRLPLLARLLQDELDGFLDLLQFRVAEPGKRHPLLEQLELALETELVGLDLRHDRFETLHRLLEAALFA